MGLLKQPGRREGYEMEARKRPRVSRGIGQPPCLQPSSWKSARRSKPTGSVIEASGQGLGGFLDART